MSNSIAVVHTAKYRETNMYNLPRKYGLRYISNYQRIGFHSHPIDRLLFKIADRVNIENSVLLVVLDLRKINT